MDDQWNSPIRKKKCKREKSVTQRVIKWSTNKLKWIIKKKEKYKISLKHVQGWCKVQNERMLMTKHEVQLGVFRLKWGQSLKWKKTKATSLKDHHIK